METTTDALIVALQDFSGLPPVLPTVVMSSAAVKVVFVGDILHVDPKSEAVKGFIHLAACLINGTMFAYNASSFSVRPSGRLARNTLLYAFATAWEAWKTKGHFEASGRHQ